MFVIRKIRYRVPRTDSSPPAYKFPHVKAHVDDTDFMKYAMLFK